MYTSIFITKTIHRYSKLLLKKMCENGRLKVDQSRNMSQQVLEKNKKQFLVLLGDCTSLQEHFVAIRV